MTWADEIDLAMRRGGSPYDAAAILRLIRAGRASFRALEHLRGSVVFCEGYAEVGHIAGRWDRSEAQELLDWARDLARARGCRELRVTGRRGWRRFLTQEGIA